MLGLNLSMHYADHCTRSPINSGPDGDLAPCDLRQFRMLLAARSGRRRQRYRRYCLGTSGIISTDSGANQQRGDCGVTSEPSRLGGGAGAVQMWRHGSYTPEPVSRSWVRIPGPASPSAGWMIRADRSTVPIPRLLARLTARPSVFFIHGNGYTFSRRGRGSSHDPCGSRSRWRLARSETVFVVFDWPSERVLPDLILDLNEKVAAIARGKLSSGSVPSNSARRDRGSA